MGVFRVPRFPSKRNLFDLETLGLKPMSLWDFIPKQELIVGLLDCFNHDQSSVAPQIVDLRSRLSPRGYRFSFKLYKGPCAGHLGGPEALKLIQ